MHTIWSQRFKTYYYIEYRGLTKKMEYRETEKQKKTKICKHEATLYITIKIIFICVCLNYSEILNRY